MAIYRRIETERLQLIPLEDGHLEQALHSIPKVCRALGLEPGEPFSFLETRRKRKVYGAKLRIIKIHPRAWLLTTAWFIAEKGEMIGELGFKGPPNLGEIEIGYGIKRSHWGRGYMTEAVEMLCRVASAQREYHVTAISARTLPGNRASHRVLEKNGFSRDGLWGKYWRWVKPISAAEEEAAL